MGAHRDPYGNNTSLYMADRRVCAFCKERIYVSCLYLRSMFRYADTACFHEKYRDLRISFNHTQKIAG